MAGIVSSHRINLSIKKVNKKEENIHPPKPPLKDLELIYFFIYSVDVALAPKLWY